MKYRIISFILCLLVVFSLTTPAMAETGVTVTAVKSSQPIYVDNESVELIAYVISGNNYVRLRDIAQVINFDVYYDGFSGTIHILTDVPYTGGQSALGQTPEAADVTASTQKIFVNGIVNSLETYNIGGNNYVKLRDVGILVDFSVEWDGTNKRVLIDTLKPYKEEAPTTSPATDTVMTIDELRAEFIRLTNIERVKAGVPELEILPELMDCAQTKAQDFFDNSYYGHNSPVYGSSGEMIKLFVPNARSSGENLAPWRKTAQDVIDGILESPEHLKNMLNSKYTHIGVGVVEGADGGYWWVQQFARIDP